MSSFGDHRTQQKQEMSRHRRRSTATARQRDPGGHCTRHPSASGSALQCTGGEWACPLPYGLKPPSKCWSLLSQALGDLRGTRRFVTTHWPCTAECVHCKTPSTSPRPRGRPLLQRLLQGYAVLTEPEDGPASGAINMQLNCARSLSAFGGAQQWEHS